MKTPVEKQISPETPRNVGLALIAGGIITLAVSLWQYHPQNRYLWDPPFGQLAAAHRLHSASYFAGWVVMLIGFIALLSVLTRF